MTARALGPGWRSMQALDAYSEALPSADYHQFRLAHQLVTTDAADEALVREIEQCMAAVLSERESAVGDAMVYQEEG